MHLYDYLCRQARLITEPAPRGLGTPEQWQQQRPYRVKQFFEMMGLPGMQPSNLPPIMPPAPPHVNMTPLQPLSPLQGPQMNWQPMQLPRMDMMPPPPRPSPGFPTHPFTRSPRDFFMWGEAMDEERARGTRPFPVP